MYDIDDNGNYVKKYPDARQSGYYEQGDFSDRYYNPIGDNVTDEPYEMTSFNELPLHKERHRDMHDYFSGKSKYVKGKGWQ